MSQQCQSHGVSNCIADPEHLFRVKCTKCDYARDFSQYGAGAAKYLYHRRRTRAAQGLLSVGAPLDAASSSYLCQTSAECGIISNTNSPHVSLVEGLVPDVDHTAAVRQLKESLHRNQTLTVVSVHRVPRRDNVMDLILADVVLNAGADYAAKQLSDGRVCKLPQFAFHVALGACPRAGGGSKRAAAWAESRLKGVTLGMDATRVRVLPPPEGSKFKQQSPRRNAHPRQQREHRYQTQMQTQAPQQQQQCQQYSSESPSQRQQQQQLQAHNSASPSQPQQQQWQNHSSVSPSQQQYCGAESQQQWQHQRSVSPVVMKTGYDTDETDAASTSTASSLSDEQEAQFPGLAVDLTFLD